MSSKLLLGIPFFKSMARGFLCGEEFDAFLDSANKLHKLIEAGKLEATSVSVCHFPGSHAAGGHDAI